MSPLLFTITHNKCFNPAGDSITRDAIRSDESADANATREDQSADVEETTPKGKGFDAESSLGDQTAPSSAAADDSSVSSFRTNGSPGSDSLEGNEAARRVGSGQADLAASHESDETVTKGKFCGWM